MNKVVSAADNVIGRFLKVGAELNDDKLEILLGNLQAALIQCPDSKFFGKDINVTTKSI